MQPASRLIQLILIVSGMLLLTTATLFGRGVNDINRLFANDRFVAGSPNPNSPLGTNLGLVTDFSNQLPFVDAFKMARTWIPHCVDTGPNQDPGCNHNNAWNTGEADSIEVDENGWVTALPAPEDGPVFTYVGTVLLLGDAGGLNHLAGQYIVLYEGEGTIEYGDGASKVEAASSPGRDVGRACPGAGRAPGG